MTIVVTNEDSSSRCWDRDANDHIPGPTIRRRKKRFVRKNEMHSDIQAERRAKRFWVSLVVTLLGIQLAVGGVAIHLATGDPTVAIVPDYHTNALNWDQEKRVQLAATRLGFQIDVETSDVADDSGHRVILVQVADASGAAADDLVILGTAYHHALAGDVRPFSFQGIGHGRYQSLAPLGRPGLWHLELMLAGAAEPMKLIQTVDIP